MQTAIFANSIGGIGIITTNDSVKDGDTITINAETNTINVEISEDELRKRKQEWKAPPLKVKRGVLYKYAKTVAPASNGCVTDEF